MLKGFALLVIFCGNSLFALSQPGSGKCLRFTGNNYVDCGNPAGNVFDFAGDGTLEAWVKISTNPPPADGVTCYSILAKDERAGEFNKWIFGVQNGKLAFHINSIDANHNWVYSNPFILVLNKYYHFAMTKNTANMVTFYVNGISMGTFTLPHVTTVVNSQMVIGYSEPGLGMDGEIDEVRFWKRILTQNEMRDWMCQKIKPAHPAWSSLVANYSLNEGSGPTSSNYNNTISALVNGPQWMTSAAPLGDSSAHDFISPIKSASIGNAYGEGFSATISKGTPAGIVVYRVDELPNTVSGINAKWNSNKYFGVFIAEVNLSLPAYTALYSYSGNPFVNALNECSIQLYKRKDNADFPWLATNVSPDLTAHTISLAGESTEYILASSGMAATWLPSMQTGLVAYYPFNGNANDQSGKGNNPTTNSATLTTDRYGNPNAAYHFDGSQYIIGNCSNFPSTTRTVSFWYRANDFTLNNDVFGYGGSVCGNSWITIFGNSIFGVAGHCGNFDTFASDPLPLYNYWHNVTISYDGGYIKIYVDGCLATSEYRGNITTTDVFNKSFYIGAIPDGTGVQPYVYMGHQWWAGDLDDVAIWNRALTDEEIKVITQSACQPHVAVSKNTADSICASTSVSFTATVTNSALPPVYQWKLNGNNVGTSSAFYRSDTLSDGDVVSCILLSPAGCALDSSNGIRMTVNTSQPLSISISSNDTDNIICAGTSVTFTATPINGGVSPFYQWKVNGNNVGTNSSTYTTTSLANNAIVICVLKSNAGSCSTGNPATSNNIQVTVNASQSLGVTISSDDADNIICAGASVTFTAIATNGGASPFYKWKINGSNTGTNDPVYTGNTFGNANIVQCVLTSNAACVTPAVAVSNNIILYTPASVRLGKDTTFCITDNFNINIADTFFAYQWSTGITSNTIKVAQPGKYWVRVQDKYGCTSADTITIAEKNCDFFIPTAFTPNGDGRNDVFKPLISGVISAYRFAVYDRWGKKIFETNDFLKGWDGAYQGQLQLSGTFIWICDYQLATQTSIQKTGTVMLVR